jgi:small subunit ribosomal protein S21
MAYYPKNDIANMCRGNTVTLREGEPVEKALRKFKKKVLESGLLRELKERETYEKPTTRRKKAKAAAKNRWRKKVSSEQLPKKLY